MRKKLLFIGTALLSAPVTYAKITGPAHPAAAAAASAAAPATAPIVPARIDAYFFANFFASYGYIPQQHPNDPSINTEILPITEEVVTKIEMCFLGATMDKKHITFHELVVRQQQAGQYRTLAVVSAKKVMEELRRTHPENPALVARLEAYLRSR